MVGLLQSQTVRLGSWAPDVGTQARYAHRIVHRWLAKHRSKPAPLYGPLIEKAVVRWGGQRMAVALDTSMWWHTYCRLRVSVIDRGRAVPLGGV